MLIYKNNGNFWPGIPARDLTDEEVKRIGEDKILLTGDYVRPQSDDKKDKGVKPPKEN